MFGLKNYSNTNTNNIRYKKVTRIRIRILVFGSSIRIIFEYRIICSPLSRSPPYEKGGYLNQHHLFLAKLCVYLATFYFLQYQRITEHIIVKSFFGLLFRVGIRWKRTSEIQLPPTQSYKMLLGHLDRSLPIVVVWLQSISPEECSFYRQQLARIRI